MTHYFLDTSVLMNIEDFQAQGHDNFGECEEYITYYTILELEGLKKSKDSSKAFAARKALHYIDDNNVAIIAPGIQCSINSLWALKFLPDTNDAKIIYTFYNYYFNNKMKEPVFFCTYDLAQRILMTTVLTKEKKTINSNFRVIHYIALDDNEETLAPYHDDITEGKGWVKDEDANIDELQANQYRINTSASTIQHMNSNNELQDISYKPIRSHFMGEVKPRNLQQEMLFDLLQNPDIKVKLALGRFGSGKSLIMLAHAIDLVQRGKFDKIVFVRNTIQVKDSKDIGLLPGSLNEKLWPFLMAVADHVGGEEGLVRLIEDNIIEPVHLGYIRGRDFKRAIIFCDECEHLTKQHVQLILGRAAEGSEVWFAGDLKQRDSKVFETNSGIVEMLKKLTGNPLFGTVTLVKSERSEVAQLADELD